ncbi:hypothetical protein BVER_03425 [Candidatus Burkholderia verschuerenii]|uniref:Uncharacterized protein n=1 Tax=Candidatus Burkholderia verschuerenii TaxID=242163 RepID=A0A0L0M687_9BURK|nr:hypothetical protein [Candidatus Burkholderia verschuerenii]KND57801.1 hypothetical protein BVER_03425 [Candidatus Burkholderia verschuerenii]
MDDFRPDAETPFAFDPLKLFEHAGPSTSLPDRNDHSLLPGALANAIVRAYEGFDELNLTDSARRVLACLIRFGLKLSDLNATTFIKKSTIAKKLGINPATVYRALEVLEVANIIYRNTQPSVMAIGTIGFTRYGLALLGLASSPTSPQKTSVTTDRSDDIARVQYVNSEPKQSFSKRQPKGLFERIKGVRLPHDLGWLVTDGLVTPFGVCSLMAQARRKGHKLSDVVEYVSTQLKSGKTRNPFAYLRALLQHTVDYASLNMESKTIAMAAAERANQAATEQALVQKVRALAGKSFRGGDDIWTVEDVGLVKVGPNGQSSSTPFHKALETIAAIVDGTFEPVAAGEAPCRTATSLLNVDQRSNPEHARHILGSLKEALAASCTAYAGQTKATRVALR